MGYARQRATEQHLADSSHKMLSNQRTVEEWKIPYTWHIPPAAEKIKDTREWESFRKADRFMQEKRDEYEAAGHDLETYQPWLELVIRFENNVLEPLENKWQQLLATEGEQDGSKSMERMAQ